MLVSKQKGVAQQIVKLVEEMSNEATTRVRTERGVSAEFPCSIKQCMGLHHGSALSPFQFVV